ncbi:MULTISPECIES: LysR family transcriptional regulator [Caballeronia]|uniref:LysR family transcriptional regulator n=1 Tax=Caballeronia TaxID=1827195 RepID=UPI0002388F7B|nr:MULTISPECIES: LysR family transcriptional regulator [unclassified Caballeronia]AET88243.1 LysR family transcriptional regulator [Burkholderia sp. YI23]MCE4542816.1 LysR substrate-binding domain-containing protein [Caballeronia sp. PC1]MCE4568128.1 LysR substrate-binding domain-containing protein [Caballeronia sp. CLC5]
MDRLGDMRLFVEAAAAGSLSAAGRKLGLSPAAASARLIKLEKALHTRLFERTTRQLRVTDEGRLYLQHCRIALQAIDDAEAALQAGQNVVRGKVRISATSNFGRSLLRGWLDEFSALHPDVRFALTLSDSVSNLLQEEIDLAIRFGAPPDSGLAARALAPNRRVLCASPDYLAKKGVPTTPAELVGHDFLVVVTAAGPLNELSFVRGDERYAYTIPLADAWETNDGALLREWALAGHGIAHKSIWDIAADVRAGTLRMVLPDWCTHEAAVHALFHANRYMAPRVRVLLDFLVERFRINTDDLLGELAYPPDKRLTPSGMAAGAIISG